MSPTPEQLAELPERVRCAVALKMSGVPSRIVARRLGYSLSQVQVVFRAAGLRLGCTIPGVQRETRLWLRPESFALAVEIAQRGGTSDEWRLRWGGTARQGREALHLARIAYGIEHKRVATEAREAKAFAHVTSLGNTQRCGRCHLLGHDRETCDLPGNATAYANRQNPDHSWMT